ncbi:helix-turn-helix transcriptional regulator [Salibacterium qingdaonense]|uniref:DNA-binding transcriptional regulator, XRE-family HTH domain n=1 Tax=Salibacterium qingdaonense TaxID=266892 RepID=A0A1I4NBH9_9BACI|nr:helix-turn-helix transcriptional regulator [Salibacterium qingdaonense]SFM12736.1 DNA-binding transcriptional regulator, XRE-family HTH domain [Salibacterium qingdaonense]
MNVEFGTKLKQLRMEQEWTQNELAEELNVTRQAVYKWETNKGYPDIQTLIKISGIFEVTIDDLIKNDKKLQNKIKVDEDESFDQFSDPGFYLGMILVLLGIFVFEESSFLLIIGLLTIVFFTDMVKSFKTLF